MLFRDYQTEKLLREVAETATDGDSSLSFLLTLNTAVAAQL